MPELVSVLRDELAKLDAELSADPRSLKAQKIRELLKLYGEVPNKGGPHSPETLADRVVAVPAIAPPPGKFVQFCGSIRKLVRPEGTAAIARSRLTGMASANNWSRAAPVWVQIEQESARYAAPGRDPHLPGAGAPPSGPGLAPAPATS